MHFFDATTLTPLSEQPIKTDKGMPVQSLTISEDGTIFAVGDSSGCISVYQVKSRTQITYIYGHRNKVLKCRITGDENDEKIISLGFD